MPQSWESPLARWTRAGLVDEETAGRIRSWEATRPAPGGMRWPVRLALGLGGLLLAAGVLLFVAAHWDALSPSRRFALVLATIAAFHLAGALSDRWPGLALTLHACGTVALGGGIFLAGQIFHLQEHWPAGVMLWAVGAAAGWVLRRDWAQGGMAAVLAPAWLASEWIALSRYRRDGGAVLAVGILGLALAYFGALPSARGDRTGIRRTLLWIGGLGLIPAAIFLVMQADRYDGWADRFEWWRMAIGWSVAVGAPVAVGWLLRGKDAWPVAAGVAWAAVAAAVDDLNGLAPYLWLALLALGVIAWGVVDRRSERVNLGIAGFALTLLAFYFSSVMDKLGRSASLIGLGLLFLGGGYLLERARRRLLAGLREAT